MHIKRFMFFALSLILAGIVLFGALLWLSLPNNSSNQVLAGAQQPVEIDFDRLGIPAIKAQTREDSYRAMGWLHARDRLFQMELLRRKGAGRLAELFGSKAIVLDKKQRSYGFSQSAAQIYSRLPESQKTLLKAYTEGVNSYLNQIKIPPPEFLALGFSAEPWQPEDSVLVGLMMFQTLNSNENEERMLTVMELALPKAMVQFLTPDQGRFDAVLIGGEQSRRPPQPVPVEAWKGIGQAAQPLLGGVDALSHIVGSNQWVVAGSKTQDGRAIVANDMHLSLGVPNIWYRASIKLAERELAGVTLPGLPMLIVGNNSAIAWGFTNVDADVLDLVRIELNPGNPKQYRTPEGWEDFQYRSETIQVKDAQPLVLQFPSTRWGPISPDPLLGQLVALHWTALMGEGVDLGQMEMEQVDTLEQAMTLINQSGGPHQNVVFADGKGQIGWTLLGRYPKRRGFDGSVSQSWAEGTQGWEGFLEPQALPRLVNPPQGFIATANNRTVGKDYPQVIGHNQANGYRAYRISEALREKSRWDEKALFELQQDSRSEFYEYYRQLAFKALDESARQDPTLDEAYRAIQAWDGTMQKESLGIGLLWLWRENLAAAVFAPIVAHCRQFDPGFAYTWRQMDTPLQALLDQQLPETLPHPRYRDWAGLLRMTLAESVRQLKQQTGVQSLQSLTWGAVNKVPVRHPFSQKLPALGFLLDMQEQEIDGCAGFCVRIVGKNHGASERMVVSPNHPEAGILHMPTGQSGHPLSAHYRDQHPAWLAGTPLPMLPETVEHHIRLQ